LSLFLRRTINTVHILPFFPSSSDRGFSIIDFSQIDPQVGTWDDIERLSLRFRLMFDGVFNHVSSKSRWFQEFLDGNPEYQDFFVKFSTKQAIDPDHLSLILRPRTTDLLTGFQSLRGPTYVWTTFSSDQIDLNFKNPEVLLQVLKVLLFYIRRGADIIRLDAVTYLWREIGTACAHLQQTHTLVKLFWAVLDVVAPQVALVTETNVPHKDNISYLGDGSEPKWFTTLLCHLLCCTRFRPATALSWADGRRRSAKLPTPPRFSIFWTLTTASDCLAPKIS